MIDWKETYLKDICELITKGTTPTSVGGRFADTGINFIKSESLNYDGIVDESKFAFIDEESNKQLKRSILKENDILFSIAGMYLGKMGIVKKTYLPANTNQACAIIRLKHSMVDYRFITLYFSERSFITYVNSLTGQAAQPNINLTDIGNLKLILPTLPTQRRIASILSAYDELIEVNNQRIKLLEETARELYKEWFVRMRFPGYKHAKFGKGLPEGWEVDTCYSFADVKGGGTPSTTNPVFWEGNINFFTPTDHSDSYFIFQTEKKITEKGLKNSSTKMFPKYSTFITARGTVGNICLAGEDMAMNQSCFGIVSHDAKDCFFTFMFTDIMVSFLKQVASGATFDAITLNTFRNYKALIPNKELRDRFTEITSPIFHQIENLIMQNTQLRQIRDRLLPRLISGKLEVKTEKVLLNSETETKYN